MWPWKSIKRNTSPANGNSNTNSSNPDNTSNPSHKNNNNKHPTTTTTPLADNHLPKLPSPPRSYRPSKHFHYTAPKNSTSTSTTRGYRSTVVFPPVEIASALALAAQEKEKDKEQGGEVNARQRAKSTGSASQWSLGRGSVLEVVREESLGESLGEKGDGDADADDEPAEK